MLATGPHVPCDHAALDSRLIADMLRLRAEGLGARPAFYDKHDGQWRCTTWAQFYERALQVAAGLARLGIEAGERVAIVGPTQPDWAFYDQGAQAAGLVSFGIYQKQSVEQIRYLVEHAEARAIFVGDRDELDRVLEATRDIDRIVAIVPWDDALTAAYAKKDPRILSPKAFRGAPLEEAERRTRQDAIDADDAAILIYTSGTTGPPKGAMITHRNVLALLSSQPELLDLYGSDISLSFLPMAHSAERILAFYGRISSGIATAYASSIGAVLDELAEVRPTVFGSVPRIYEKAYARIWSEVERKPPLVGKLFRWAVDVGVRKVRLELAGAPVPAGLALRYRVASRLVFRKIRAAFGGRVRFSVCGAAPVAVDILELFWAAGVPILELYGMTEATVITHGNRPGAVRLGSVGTVIPPMEHRIADDGEVLVRGPWVFKGYFKDPDATASAIVDGWLQTGDVGRIDADGYLYITDRKKHLIITAGGKNLTPANIEKAIKSQDPLVSHVHAHGDRRPYISALVAPSPLETLEWGIDHGLVTRDEYRARLAELMDDPSGRTAALEEAMGRVVAHPDFEARLREAVLRGNSKLANVERVRRFTILARDFSQEHGELTPTMKLKRRSIEEAYAPTFDRIYDEPEFSIEA